jgi:hypothetical protein
MHIVEYVGSTPTGGLRDAVAYSGRSTAVRPTIRRTHALRTIGAGFESGPAHIDRKDMTMALMTCDYLMLLAFLAVLAWANTLTKSSAVPTPHRIGEPCGDGGTYQPIYPPFEMTPYCVR